MGATIRHVELKLVDPNARRQRTDRRVLLALVATIAIAFGWTTWRGATKERTPLDARQFVNETVSLALTEGNESDQVLERLRRLRAQLGERPLDSKTRVHYAALLLSLTREPADTRAPAFHARAAAELSPVTLPVVELAALILARSGEAPTALDLVRDIFGFEPEAAARLLGNLEDGLEDHEIALALGDEPQAWAAWAAYLAENSRATEATTLLEDAVSRWPGAIELLVPLARSAARGNDWDALYRHLESLDELPRERRTLELLAYRSLLRAHRGETELASEDLATLGELAADNPAVLVIVGETEQQLGHLEGARRAWNRALFLLPGERRGARLALLVRLATLEETDGRASVALRHWRAVLQLDPGHARAQRRVAELTGVRG